MTLRTRHTTSTSTQTDASTTRAAREAAALQADPQLVLLYAYLKQLRLPAIARECVPLARAAEQQGVGFLGYLQTLVEQEVTQRHEHQLRRYLKQAQFPYDKRLEDFDFSLAPSLPKTRVLELAQGAFLTQHENVLLVGPSGLGKPQPANSPCGSHISG